MFEAPHQVEPAVIATRSFAPGLAPLAQIDFHRICSALWRDKATILATTIASLLLMMLFILLVPHRYTAVAQILIDPTDLHAVANELTPASQVSDTALLQVESQVRVLSSDIVLRRVIKAQALDHDAEFVGSPSLPRRLLSVFGLGGGRPADAMLAALSTLKRVVQVKRTERTYVVDVSVSSRSPEKAARLANAVMQAYLAEQTAVRAAAARQVSDSLSARLNELKDRVRESEERAEAFKARNNIVDAGGGQLINEQQLTELNNQLGAARARTAEAKARLDQIERLQRTKGDIGAFPQAVQSPTITALRSQYAEVVRREAEQMTSLGPRHPAVIDIEAQAERLRRMIGEEVNRTALAARSEYESAHANEQALARNLETLKHNAITTSEAMVTLRELERDVQASRAVYESFLVRARETGEQERLDTKNIRVISPADLPLRRSFPPSNTLLALAALILGAAAGTGIVITRMPGEPGGGPRPRREPSKLAKLSLPPAKPPVVPVLATLPGIDAGSGRDAAGNPKSPFTARIRKVHDALRASHNNDDHPSILVVAGDGADDTVAVALGLAAVAALNERVLLIDADLERRTLSAFAADEGDGGLVDVAVGRRVLADVVVRDRETNINMMPFVSPHSRRGREIKDEDVKLAFAQTKSFELVIVAAIDSEQDPSGRFFAGLVDQIVLVVRADADGESRIARLASRLGADAPKIRGAVLTGVAA